MYCSVAEIRASTKQEFLEMAISDYLINSYDEIDEKSKQREIEKVVAEAIDDASAEINGYLLKKYSINQLKKIMVIRKICKDITLYNILSRSGNDENNRENNYYLRYKNAIKFLESVAKGMIEVNFDDCNNEESTSRKVGIKVNSSPKLFSRNSLGGM